MTTQTLRGLDHHGPMHWRGDRTGAVSGMPGLALDEELAFEAFNVAFPGLIGRDEGQLSVSDMQAFTDFALEIVLPPNPIRKLDNSLRNTSPRNEMVGEDLYINLPDSDGIDDCERCHTLLPGQGFIGTRGLSTDDTDTLERQEFKIPHLRNAYQKVGMFGMHEVGTIDAGDNGHKLDQIRGFGFQHDGSVDTVFRFLKQEMFEPLDTEASGDASREDLEAFIMAFPSTFAPVVGQQVTLTSTSGVDVTQRIDLLVARAKQAFVLVGDPGARECDLVVKATIGGQVRGWVMDSSPPHDFLPDATGDAALPDASLRLLAVTPGQELTYTCTPPGTGQRSGLDRDEDGVLDFDDACPTWAQASATDSNLDGIPDDCQCGDADGNGRIQASDAFAIATCVSAGPCPALDLADTDNNGALQSADAFNVAGTVVDPITNPTHALTCLRRPQGTPPN